MDLFSFLIGVFFAYALVGFFTEDNKGELAEFSENDSGEEFLVEVVAKEAGICRIKYDEKSLWYEIPMLGSGITELIPNRTYLLSWNSFEIPMFIEK